LVLGNIYNFIFSITDSFIFSITDRLCTALGVGISVLQTCNLCTALGVGRSGSYWFSVAREYNNNPSYSQKLQNRQRRTSSIVAITARYVSHINISQVDANLYQIWPLLTTTPDFRVLAYWLECYRTLVGVTIHIILKLSKSSKKLYWACIKNLRHRKPLSYSLFTWCCFI